jgi:hypothetical protein
MFDRRHGLAIGGKVVVGGKLDPRVGPPPSRCLVHFFVQNQIDVSFLIAMGKLYVENSYSNQEAR